MLIDDVDDLAHGGARLAAIGDLHARPALGDELAAVGDVLDAHDERVPERRAVDLGQASQLGGLSVVGLPQSQRGGVQLEVDDAGVVGDECLPILG